MVVGMICATLFPPAYWNTAAMTVIASMIMVKRSAPRTSRRRFATPFPVAATGAAITLSGAGIVP